MGKTFVQDHCKRPDQMAGNYKKKKKRIYKKGEVVGQLIPLFKFRKSDEKKKKKRGREDRRDSATES